MVEDAVRREAGVEDSPSPSETMAPDTEPGSIDGAGLTAATKLRPPGLLELENLLAEQLDTRVSVQLTAKRGRVTIEFADLEDLERIYRVITG
jgi:ParB family chromosome partitioning protein